MSTNLMSKLSVIYSRILEGKYINKSLKKYVKEKSQLLTFTICEMFSDAMKELNSSDETEYESAQEYLYSSGMKLMECLAPVTKSLRFGANREFMETEGKTLAEIINNNYDQGVYNYEKITEEWIVYLLSNNSVSPLGISKYVTDLLASRCFYLSKKGDIENIFSIFKYEDPYIWQDMAEELDELIVKYNSNPMNNANECSVLASKKECSHRSKTKSSLCNKPVIINNNQSYHCCNHAR